VTFAIASNGFAEGPAQALRDLLVARGARVVTAFHPLTPEQGTRHVVTEYADGRVVAERAAAQPLPPGLVRDGIVVDPEGLGRELKRLFAEHRLGKRVRVGLATPRTILRVVDLPPLEERDIEPALRMQAHETLPLQRRKRLAHRGGAHAEAPRELDLPQARAGFEHAGDDVLAQARGHGRRHRAVGTERADQTLLHDPMLHNRHCRV
jgi:hypothetical protein